MKSTKKYKVKQSRVTVTFYDRSACVTLKDLTSKPAWAIGLHLQRQMVCEDVSVEWNGYPEIWLEDFDFGLYDEAGLKELLVAIGKELGYDFIME